MDKKNIQALDFNDIWFIIYKLYKRIHDSSFDPEVIVGIARGGYPVARIFCDLFGIGKVAMMGIEFYTGINETKEKPQVLYDVPIDIDDKRVLLVDDVADTGKSLELAKRHLEKKNIQTLKIATLHYKPQSIIKPDFYYEKTEDWIVYPWEMVEFTRDYVKKRKKEKIEVEQIIHELQEIALPAIVIREVIQKE
ncbi:MAG: phosphoribosyltransferase [Candidatus Heimdallarchaeota archaeon]|nr:phosphoribosyltransferase [Candidatus Heimdallarchaeota archaeon]